MVMRKIWWYEWNMKQREICEEYKERFCYRPEKGDIVMKGDGKYGISYNWRELDSWFYSDNIYNHKGFAIMKKLSKNYTYSNGDRFKIDYFSTSPLGGNTFSG